MSVFKPLLPHQRRFGWLVSHTQEDGAIEIPLVEEARKNEMLRHWATGNGRFRVEEFNAAGGLQPSRGDAWEPPAPIPMADWVKSV